MRKQAAHLSRAHITLKPHHGDIFQLGSYQVDPTQIATRTTTMKWQVCRGEEQHRMRSQVQPIAALQECPPHTAKNLNFLREKRILNFYVRSVNLRTLSHI